MHAITLTGLPAGTHAIHVHEIGKCDAPFTTAGGHLNTAKKSHGFMNPDGAFTGTGTITVVPEPATLAMMGLGAGLLLGVQRFRRKLR